MNVLRKYAGEHLDVLAAYRAEHSQVHGFDAYYHPGFVRLWELAQTLSPPSWRAVRARLRDEQFPLSVLAPGHDPSWLGTHEPTTSTVPMPRDLGEVRDFDEDSAWREMAQSLGFTDPFVVRVNLLPGSRRPPETPELEGPMVLYRHAPPVEATNRKGRVDPLRGGISLGGSSTGTTGTLGGILTDPGGTEYCVTCAHVLPAPAPGADDSAVQPSQADDRRKARPIGDVVARSDLKPSLDCSRGLNPGSMNRVDAALVEADGVEATTEVEGVGPLEWHSLPSAGERVEVSAVSGLHRLHAIHVSVLTAVVIDGNSHCFDSLMGLWTGATPRRTPIKQGDSGAWVIREVWENATRRPKHWSGMIVGTRPTEAYAVASDDILQWAEGEGFSDLTFR